MAAVHKGGSIRSWLLEYSQPCLASCTRTAFEQIVLVRRIAKTYC